MALALLDAKTVDRPECVRSLIEGIRLDSASDRLGGSLPADPRGSTTHCLPGAQGSPLPKFLMDVVIIELPPGPKISAQFHASGLVGSTAATLPSLPT